MSEARPDPDPDPDPRISTEPDGEALVTRLEALQLQINQLHAEQLQVLADLDRADTSEQRWIAETVSALLRISIPTARLRLRRARRLTEDLPSTLAAVATGDIPAWYADLIAEAASQVNPDTWPEYERRVLKRARHQTMTQLRASIKRALIAVDPATMEQNRVAALADRAVTVFPAEHGLAELRLTHSAESIRAVWERLDAAARLLPTDDPRGRDQQRADLLIDGLLTGLPLTELPTAQGRRPTVQIVVQASTLLGADDQPAWLHGYGPITAQLAREIASDPTGTWQRLLTDPDTGQLLDAGARTYRPSRHLINFLSARDGVCSFPTCNQPAHRCHVEHCHEYATGGHTTRANTAMVCKRHNEMKKPGGSWRYQVRPDGTHLWTEQHTQRHYTNQPPEHWETPTPTNRDREIRRLENNIKHARDTGHTDTAERHQTQLNNQLTQWQWEDEHPDEIPF